MKFLLPKFLRFYRNPNFRVCSYYSQYYTTYNKNTYTPHHASIHHRLFCSKQEPQKLQIMEYGLLVWPSVIKTIKNWIYASFIIRPYFDPDFSLHQFVEGAQHAAEKVSQLISEGNLQDLNGLLTSECLEAVKNGVSKLNAKQRHDIAIKKDDFYFSFPYEVGVIYDEKGDSTESAQNRFVEITVVHHVMKGRKEMLDRGDDIPLNIGVLPEYQDKLFILNYRFIRNYTKGVSDQWTLNVVNHFKPSDYAK